MQIRQLWLCLIASLICLVSAVGPAQATLMVFSGEAAFFAATSASPATTIPTTPLTVFPPDTGFTNGSLSFSLVPGESSRFIIDNFSARLPGNELALSGKETFNIDINTGAVFAFGFDFVEPEFDPFVNATPVDSTFGVTLKNGSTTVGAFTFARPNDSAQFVGAWTGPGEGFNRVEIREVIGDAENEFFGQFYTGLSPMQTVVPEPSTLLLLGSGLAGLAAWRRGSGQAWRRKRKA